MKTPAARYSHLNWRTISSKLPLLFCIAIANTQAAPIRVPCPGAEGGTPHASAQPISSPQFAAPLALVAPSLTGDSTFPSFPKRFDAGAQYLTTRKAIANFASDLRRPPLSGDPFWSPRNIELSDSLGPRIYTAESVIASGSLSLSNGARAALDSRPSLLDSIRFTEPELREFSARFEGNSPPDKTAIDILLQSKLRPIKRPDGALEYPGLFRKPVAGPPRIVPVGPTLPREKACLFCSGGNPTLAGTGSTPGSPPRNPNYPDGTPTVKDKYSYLSGAGALAAKLMGIDKKCGEAYERANGATGDIAKLNLKSNATTTRVTSMELLARWMSSESEANIFVRRTDIERVVADYVNSCLVDVSAQLSKTVGVLGVDGADGTNPISRRTCTATLIAQNKILTARHCLMKDDTNTQAYSFLAAYKAADVRERFWFEFAGEPEFQFSVCSVDRPTLPHLASDGGEPSNLTTYHEDHVVLTIAEPRGEVKPAVFDRKDLKPDEPLFVPGWNALSAQNTNPPLYATAVSGCHVASDPHDPCTFHACQTLPGWSGAPMFRFDADGKPSIRFVGIHVASAFPINENGVATPPSTSELTRLCPGNYSSQTLRTYAPNVGVRPTIDNVP